MASNLTVQVQAGKLITETVTISVSETYLNGFSVESVSFEAESESYAGGFLELHDDPPYEKEFTVHLRGS